MMHDVVGVLAASLKAGKLPPSQPRDLAAAVRLIADDLAGPATTVCEVRDAASVLNNQGQFNHTRTLGKAWRANRPFDASVTKRYAQALIDLFELDSAEEMLNDALVKARAPDADAQASGEIPEYLGLLGRIEKQRFVSSNDKARLVNATDRYLAQLDKEHASDRWFYHAINAIALAAREKREGVAPSQRKNSVPPAKDVLARMKKLYLKTPKDPWVPATASEACLALDKCDDAELWLYRFLNHPEVEPFNLQSYDRQLREIWEGDPAGAGTRCADRLARIMSRHIMRTQAQFTIAIAAVPALKQALEGSTSEGLEKNFLGEGTFSVANVRDMLAACSSIGCVTNTSGARLGTGFLIDGTWLGFADAGPVFLTNAHVISASVPKAIVPENARVTFEVESELAKTPVYYEVNKVLCSSPPAKLGTSSDDELDVTIVTLRPTTRSTSHISSLRTAEQLPLIEDRAKAYVVGHPLGGGLQISLHDSVLLDVDDAQRLVHYRTPTDPGSSGSPVFNTEWQVIGLHHGGSGKTPRLHGAGDYEANEAISLLSIRDHVARCR